MKTTVAPGDTLTNAAVTSAAQVGDHYTADPTKEWHAEDDTNVVAWFYIKVNGLTYTWDARDDQWHRQYAPEVTDGQPQTTTLTLRPGDRQYAWESQFVDFTADPQTPWAADEYGVVMSYSDVTAGKPGEGKRWRWDGSDWLPVN